MWSAIAKGLELILEIFKNFFSPERRRKAELRKINEELAELYARRDHALSKNNSDDLTAITARIIFLRNKAKDYVL